jgi:ubiquinone/menaquinone biosynthesis C-methylase UbiE
MEDFDKFIDPKCRAINMKNSERDEEEAMTETEQRWLTAQTYEKQWWENRVASLDLEFYQAYAEDLTRELSGILDMDRHSTILEIGSGAAGILTFLPGEVRHAIDPLENFYSTVPKFIAFRDKRVQYQTMKAENLEFADEMFDLIICDNVFDHCDDPDRVLQEMLRTLKGTGAVYLRLVTYHFWGRFVRIMLEKFQIDKGHPHTFTKKSLAATIRRNGLCIVKMKSKGYLKTWRDDLFSGSFKGVAKALLFATRDKTLYVLKG